MSNADCLLTQKKLGRGLTKLVVERAGRRIGFMGLIEHDWLATLATIDPEDVEYESFVTCGIRLAAELREVDKVDLVIAVTHMRLPNDRKLAEDAGGVIDLILGGHDHTIANVNLGGATIVKSGSDFKDLSEIVIEFFDDEPNADGAVGTVAGQKTLRPVIEVRCIITLVCLRVFDSVKITDL